MARNKLRMQTLFTGMTVYGIIGTLDDRVYRSNGTLETYAAGTLASYAVAAGAEEGASRAYPLTLPANLPAGVYTVDAFKRVGASPAEGDPLVWQTPDAFAWDGTNVLALSDVISETGAGARTVVLAVNDGSAALEGALVRVTKGALTYVDSTDAAGQITFNLDDGTWTVAITLAGYTFAGTTLVVDGDETATYSMTANSTTPSAPARVTGYLYCYDEDGVAEVGVEIRCQATGGTTAGGVAHDATVRTETSGAGGYAEFTNLLPGATYDFWRGITTTRKTSVTIPADAATPYALSDVIGRP